jgi:hypothetical protein
MVNRFAYPLLEVGKGPARSSWTYASSWRLASAAAWCVHACESCHVHTVGYTEVMSQNSVSPPTWKVVTCKEDMVVSSIVSWQCFCAGVSLLKSKLASDWHNAGESGQDYVC